MKKLTVLLLALAVVALPACKNQGKKSAKAPEEHVITPEEQLVIDALKVDLDNFLVSTKQIKNLPFTKSDNGGIQLTEQEKMVKPDYLMDPDFTDGLVTLSQKYRALGVCIVDKKIAELYDMPVDGYENAIAKIVVSINDPAFNKIAEEKTLPEGEEFSKLMDDEYNAGRANYFWDFATAAIIEQIYICTRDIDRFTAMFDDQTASDVTYNFVLIHEGVLSVSKFYPEMESLNNVLGPLYVINAISVAQLKEQLIQLGDDIEAARVFITK